MSNPSHLPPGFYQDPRDPGQLRYWDGYQWTDQTKEDPHADHGRPQDRVRILTAKDVNDQDFDPDNPKSAFQSKTGMHEASVMRHNLGSVLVMVLAILLLALGVYLFILAGNNSGDEGKSVQSTGQVAVNDPSDNRPISQAPIDESAKSRAVTPVNGSTDPRLTQKIPEAAFQPIVSRIVTDLRPGYYLRTNSRYADTLLQCKSATKPLKNSECLAFITPAVKAKGLMFEGYNYFPKYQGQTVTRPDLIKIIIKPINSKKSQTGNCAAYIDQNQGGKPTRADIVCE